MLGNSSSKHNLLRIEWGLRTPAQYRWLGSFELLLKHVTEKHQDRQWNSRGPEEFEINRYNNFLTLLVKVEELTAAYGLE